MGNYIQSGLGTAAALDPEPISKSVLAVTTGFVALTRSILHAFGVGPNPNNVPASQAEQAFEIAGRNLNFIYMAGMISNAQRQAGISALLRQGQNFLGQIISHGGDVKPFQDALTNMTKAMSASYQGSHLTRPQATRPLTLEGARQYYDSGSGWYPGSVQKGAELTDGVINDFLSSPIAQISGFGQSIGQEIASATGSKNVSPNTAKYIGWGAIGLLAAKLLHFF